MKRISLILLWGFCSMALSNVSFHGYLVQPPNCTISNAQTIEITFQDVLIDDINGSNYEQTVPGNDSNLLMVFYVQIMPDDFVMQLHRF